MEQAVPVRKKLFIEERLSKIMEVLSKQKKVEVDQLTERFNVSGTTIRSDLRELQKQNLVRRTHGGAILKELGIHSFTDPMYADRIERNLEQKISIGKVAAAMISDDDFVLIDDGSTTLQVVRALNPKTKATFLTNGLDICYELVKETSSTVYSSGGKMDKDDFSFYGLVALDAASRFNGTKAILGVSALSLKRGITSPSEEKAELKRTMIEHADQVIIVADYTKIDSSSFIEVAPLNAIDILISDGGASSDFIMQIEDLGIEVIIAKDK
jgi:DeoR family transcriptional regulator, fructose operon transcriptional repressor